MKTDISSALERNLTARRVFVVGAIGSALSLLAGIPMSASAMDLASGNPVCRAIKAEGGAGAGCNDGIFGGPAPKTVPAQNPIKPFWPVNFPHIDQSGPSAQTPSDLSPGFLGGQIEPKPKRHVCRMDQKLHKLVCPTEPL